MPEYSIQKDKAGETHHCKLQLSNENIWTVEIWKIEHFSFEWVLGESIYLLWTRVYILQPLFPHHPLSHLFIDFSIIFFKAVWLFLAEVPSLQSWCWAALRDSHVHPRGDSYSLWTGATSSQIHNEGLSEHQCNLMISFCTQLLSNLHHSVWSHGVPKETPRHWSEEWWNDSKEYKAMGV